jgi:hypothetical protein
LADQIKPNVAIFGAHGLASPYVDTSAFAPVSTARFGTSSFDSLRGPGYGNCDCGLFRTVEVYDWLKAQVRAEALNLTNHPNFGNPDRRGNGLKPGSDCIDRSVKPPHRGTLLSIAFQAYLLAGILKKCRCLADPGVASARRT